MTKRKNPDDWFTGLTGAAATRDAVQGGPSYAANAAYGRQFYAYGYGYDGYGQPRPTANAAMTATGTQHTIRATPAKKESSLIIIDDDSPPSSQSRQRLSVAAESVVSDRTSSQHARPMLQKDPSLVILNTPPRGAKKSTTRMLEREPTIEFVDGPTIVLPPAKRQRRTKEPQTAKIAAQPPKATIPRPPAQTGPSMHTTSYTQPNTASSVASSAQLPAPTGVRPKPTPTYAPHAGPSAALSQTKARNVNATPISTTSPPSLSKPFPTFTSSPMPGPSKPLGTPSSVPSHPPRAPLPDTAPAPPPAKGKGKAPQGTQPRAPKQPKQVQEKRQAMMKKKCPIVTRERLERVTTQRFFMVDRKRVDRDGELREEFQVLGSTGNVYTVTIQKVPSCNCPDALKGNQCKHILFVFAKVLQVPFESHVWYQKALLSTELEEVFAHAPLAPNDVSNPRIVEAHAQAAGKVPAVGGKKRAIEEGTECPICYEEMFGTQETLLTLCDTCGNALHKVCFGEWAKTKGLNITCPFCRAKWAVAAAAAPAVGGRAGGSRAGEGYLNLANAAGLSPVRDTSTYYHGPRRGERHMGYHRYDDVD